MRILRAVSITCFVFAALLAVGAGIYIAISPQTVTEITAQTTGGGLTEVEETTHQISWRQAQGTWGIIILFIFALLFALPSWLAVSGHTVVLMITSSLALILTYLSGLSIGPYYLPSATAILIGCSTYLIEKARRERSRPDSAA